MAAETARSEAVTRGTNADRVRLWNRWKQFLHTIDIPNDPYLLQFTHVHVITIFCAFAQYIRKAGYSNRISNLAEGTVCHTIDNVAQTFREGHQRDPRLDIDGRPSRLLQQQLRGYKNADPPPKHQKALPVCILTSMSLNSSFERSRAIAELSIGAFFFAMRSCEYLQVSGTRKTKRLTLRNLRFFFQGTELDHRSPLLANADVISITFVDQKNDQRNDTITMHASQHPTLCPVKSWAKIIQRILSYKNTTIDEYVNTIFYNDKFYEITSNDSVKALRAAALAIGSSTLGFNPQDIGTHSIRSGAAMAMYLDEVPVYTIMLIGRWSSDAFLLYIRKQVEQFSHNVSSRMIRHVNFTHIPDFQPTISRHDPRQRNHRANTQTRYNLGTSSSAIITILPNFALHT